MLWWKDSKIASSPDTTYYGGTTETEGSSYCCLICFSKKKKHYTIIFVQMIGCGVEVDDTIIHDTLYHVRKNIRFSKLIQTESIKTIGISSRIWNNFSTWFRIYRSCTNWLIPMYDLFIVSSWPVFSSNLESFNYARAN